MAEHRTGTREEWLAARKRLLEREKELTRRSDALVRERQDLPWVAVDKEYVFETNEGPKTLPELFDGRSQLLVYHFMFGPSVEGWPEAGCLGCSYTADSLDGAVGHLPHRDVSFVAVSRAPLDRLNTYKQRMGWSFPWVSFGESDFNLDFGLFTEEERRTGKGFNFGTPAAADLKSSRDRAARAERTRAGGRRRLPHLFDVRPRNRRPQRHLAAPRPDAEGARRRLRELAPPARRVLTRSPATMWPDIRGRPGFDVVGSPAELQAEVPGRPRKTTGNNQQVRMTIAHSLSLPNP
jgi:predicted dithiol-disulfide oxidoreductase (DUF899 family)